MTRNLKVLGLALLAMAAVGAVAAQGALGAVEHEFHFDGPKANLTGENVTTTKFAVGAAGTFECTTATFEATQPGVEVSAGTYRSDTLTVTSHHSGCTFGGTPANININHCATQFDSETTTGNSDGGEHANVLTECTEGNKVEIDTSLCTITIAPQEIKHAVRFENDKKDANKSSIIVKTTAKNVVVGKIKTTESQTGCLLFPTGAIGSITSETTYKCFKDIGMPLEGTSKTTPTERLEHGSTTECTVSPGA